MLLPTTCLGCGVIVRGRSRCARCSTSTARGYGGAWQQTSRALIREHPYCTWCGATADLTVDHIVPMSKGGTHARGNLRVLCRPCNSGRSNRARES